MASRFRILTWGATLRRRGQSCAAVLRLYCQIRRERQQLLALTDRERRDIGITRYDAVCEARKPVWPGLWTGLRRRNQARADPIEDATESGAPRVDPVVPQHVLARRAADAPPPLGVLHELLHDAEKIAGKRAE